MIQRPKSPYIVVISYHGSSWSVEVEFSCLGCAYLRPATLALCLLENDGFRLHWASLFLEGKRCRGPNRYQIAFICLLVATGMLGRGQLRYHVILELSGQTPCFLLANAVIEEGFPLMRGCLPYAATCAHICAPYCNGNRLECSCSFCGAKRWNATLQLVLGAVNSSWKCRICCHGRITQCIRI